MARAASPPGGSTLTTSAPKSARIMLAAGPATMVLRSRTRTPASREALAFSSAFRTPTSSAGRFDAQQIARLDFQANFARQANFVFAAQERIAAGLARIAAF